jgi:hypothetical protein
LSYPAVRILYYFGATIHETSHAVFCILTGAKITEFSIFSKQPHVTSQNSKIPILGQFLISLAPIIGGLAFLFVLNHYFLSEKFIIPEISSIKDFLFTPFNLFIQINFLNWQSWLMILLFLNVGAMLGPSFQDLKNIWPLIVISFFIKWTLFSEFGLLVLALILTNIVLQIILIFITFILRKKSL